MNKILNFDDEAVQYIEITQDMQFRDFSGRFTEIFKESRGAILTEKNIPSIYDITPKQIEKLKDHLESAKDRECILALVSGYPCTLREKDYKLIKKPREGLLPVPWEIL